MKEGMEIDVSGLVSDARELMLEVSRSYIEHTSQWFIGLMAHGSVVKGGFIPGCSDVDLHLYLEDDAFRTPNHLLLGVAFRIRGDLLKLDPAPFRYVQCYPQSRELRPGWVGPIPGAYHLIAGELPVPEATATDLVESADAALSSLNPSPMRIVQSLLGRGAGRFSRNLRLLCTEVWPTVYQVLIVSGADPVATWSLPKKEAVPALPDDLRGHAQLFLDGLMRYYPGEQDIQLAQELVESGHAVLAGAKEWYEARS